MAQANMSDFFGEGVNAQPAAPAAPVNPDDQPNPNNPGGISNNELRRRQQLLQQSATQTANINAQGVNYNSPVDAALAQQTAQPAMATYQNATRTPGTPGSTFTDSHGRSYTITGGVPQGFNSIADYNASLGTVQSAGYANGAQQLAFTPPSNPPQPGTNYQPTVDNGQATAQNLTDQVLGSQPTVPDQNQVNATNRDALTPVVNPSLATTDATQQALALSQNLVDRIFGLPLQTSMLADREMQNQLAIARGARGGPGAVNVALSQAQQQAPALSEQAAQQTIQEQQARANAAGQAVGLFSNNAQNDAQRAVAIATANQNAGLSVLNNLTTLTGQSLQYDATKMQTLGQLAGFYLQNSAQFAALDTQQQIAVWDNAVKTYGIDKDFDAKIKGYASAHAIGPLEAFSMILGVAKGAGSAALTAGAA